METKLTSELEEFTTFLFGEDKGFAYAPTLRRSDNKWEPRFFLWPIERENLHTWIRSNSIELDVYLSPVLFKSKSSKKEEVKSSRVVWVEFDGQQEIDYKDVPPPSWTIQSSNTSHRHCYWSIPTTIQSEIVEETNRRLTYFFGADGSGWDISQVLRPPETINHKPDRNQDLVKTLEKSDRVYDLSSFDKAPKLETPVIILNYENLPQPEEVLAKYKLPDILLEKVNREIPGPLKRSDLLMHTCYLLVENGIDNHSDLVSLLYHMDSRIRKYVGRQDQLVRLSEIASLGLRKNVTTVEVYDFEEILSFENKHIWLIPDGWLHSSGLLMIASAPGVGKSQMGYNWLANLAEGISIFGKPSTQPVKGLFVSLEMGPADTQYIIGNQSKEFTNRSLVKSNLLSVFPEDFSMTWLKAIIKAVKPQVVLIDTVSEIVESLKDSSEAIKLMKAIRQIRAQFNVAFIFLHHNRKPGEGNKKANKLSDIYGAVEFASKSETVLSLWTDEDKPNSPIELNALKVRFGTREIFNVVRSQNLTFYRETKVTGPTPVNPLFGLE